MFRLTNVAHDWDASILRELTSARLATLTHPECSMWRTHGLVNAAPLHKHRSEASIRASVGAMPGAELFTSQTARTAFESITVGDVVLMLRADGTFTIGKVLWHLGVKEGDAEDVVSGLVQWKVGEEEALAWKCSVTTMQFVASTSDITCALMFSTPPGVKTVLKPRNAMLLPDNASCA